MKGLVYGGPGSRRWVEVPDPVVREPEDAILRVDAVTICGTDLHILEGAVPSVQPGQVDLEVDLDRSGWGHDG